MSDYIAKTQPVGLIGGMSHETSDHYVPEIHRLVNEKLGGLHSAQLVHLDVDFAEIRALMLANHWAEIADKLHSLAMICAQQRVAGIAFASNTIHKAVALLADHIDSPQMYIHGIPVIHIGDSIIRALPKSAQRLLLLGTNFTMSDDFMTSYLRKAGYEVIVPEADDREKLDDIIFNELCKGKKNAGSELWFLNLIFKIVAHEQIDAVILGCTELPMLLEAGFKRFLPNHAEIKEIQAMSIVDSAAAHIQHVAEYCIKPEFR